MLFAALITSCLASMLHEASAAPNAQHGQGTPQGGGLDIDKGLAGGGGSNNYLLIAIAGIVIAVAVLLIIKFGIPKFKAK